ncbi:MAG: primosomal replication protein N [Leptothrix sp. (in: b-proteobacteria)]|jgi:primosomal replication protein N
MNQTVLSAQIVERAAMRYTPAGLPVMDVRIAHTSQVMQDGAPRQISFEMHAVAVGELAWNLERRAVGSTAEFHGFLGKQRNGKGVMLHIDRLADSCNVTD